MNPYAFMHSAYEALASAQDTALMLAFDGNNKEQLATLAGMTPAALGQAIARAYAQQTGHPLVKGDDLGGQQVFFAHLGRLVYVPTLFEAGRKINPAHVPNAIFNTTMQLRRFEQHVKDFSDEELQLDFVQAIAQRALAAPECYRGQPVYLRAQLEQLALRVGMAQVALQLQALCTATAQLPGDALDGQEVPQTSNPQA